MNLSIVFPVFKATASSHGNIDALSLQKEINTRHILLHNAGVLCLCLSIKLKETKINLYVFGQKLTSDGKIRLACWQDSISRSSKVMISMEPAFLDTL